MILYGIKNCDTVRKARRWCEANDIEVKFHDFRSDGLDETILNQWLTLVTWEDLLNKRSTTWRNLDDPRKDQLDANNAIALMIENPTLIKRPVLMDNSHCILGFKADIYANHFGK
ncbi:MAG: ArsC family reductase [Gammaproteobacteria bacterium]|nr:MAG: ArsC family reductase [Gammaproteobacteria bacterium]